MGETREILGLWRRAKSRGERVCLVTVVHVEGSSYRKPGARMLVTAGGERAGTVSGGCLEAEVSRKAWWLTQGGAAVERYHSSFDEDGTGTPWGLGCGGTVTLLLEQEPEAVLRAMEASLDAGSGFVIVTRLQAPAGTLAVVADGSPMQDLPGERDALRAAAASVRVHRESLALDAGCAPASGLPSYFVEYLAPPPRLTVFGAGDDAQPLVGFAQALGWRVTVADGRSHLLRPERFPSPATLRLLRFPDAEAQLACGVGGGAATTFSRLETGVGPGEFAVLLTHSYEQDRALLASLLPEPLGFLGILGPRHRTRRLVDEIAPRLGWDPARCMERLHAPVGLDLGARDPAAIALAIVAQLQATLAGRRVALSPEPPGPPVLPLPAALHA